jgi:heptosyltransferase-2
VVVRLPNWLGDGLMSRPALHALRERSAEVTAVGPGALLGLLAAERTFARHEIWPQDDPGRARLLGRVRAWRPETVLVLPPSFSSALWAWRTGAPVRAGYRHDARGLLLTAALRRPARGERHLADEYLALVEAAMGPAAAAARAHRLPPLAVPEEGHAAAGRRLEAAGLARARVAILGPGAVYGPAKRWPPERFAEVGRWLAGQGLAVLVCGAAAEAATCAAVAAGAGPGARSLVGETGLAEMAALCARADVVVCNDSGLAHLAAAVGAPTVVIFGSTSSAWTAPLGPRVRVVQDAPVCSPCFRRTCRIGTPCLTAVDVERVQRACDALGAPGLA